MKILDTIVQHKKKEVEAKKELYPIKLLESSKFFKSPCVSLKDYILRADKSGIIAEFKRKSPSIANINLYADPEEISISYMQGGASAISVLTDENFFGAKEEDIETVRSFNLCPVLQKDFIIDEYQIIEARSRGADVILLICEILTKEKLASLHHTAKGLGMEVLIEMHTDDQLTKIPSGAEIVGINNRNLEDFSVDYERSIKTLEQLPAQMVKIAESGLSSIDTVLRLKKSGFDGFLIGEQFMKQANPGDECRRFAKELINLKTAELCV